MGVHCYLGTSTSSRSLFKSEAASHLSSSVQKCEGGQQVARNPRDRPGWFTHLGSTAFICSHPARTFFGTMWAIVRETWNGRQMFSRGSEIFHHFITNVYRALRGIQIVSSPGTADASDGSSGASQTTKYFFAFANRWLQMRSRLLS